MIPQLRKTKYFSGGFMKKINKDAVYRAAIDAMNCGYYVTIISFVRANGVDYIKGQTFKSCVLQTEKMVRT